MGKINALLIIGCVLMRRYLWSEVGYRRGGRSWSHSHHSLILSEERRDKVGAVPRGDRENIGRGELPEVGWGSRYVATPNIQRDVLIPGLALNCLCTLLVGR